MNIKESINKAKPIIIFGSSSNKGAAWEPFQLVLPDGHNIPIINLKNLNISPYDYEHKNQDDDYLPLMRKVVTHDPIILATPVYWYTMSAQLKIFIDRLSDLLTIAKDLGRQLHNKHIYILAGFSTVLPRGFEEAFIQTCEYLKMHYLGCSFIYQGSNPALLQANTEAIAHARQVLEL